MRFKRLLMVVILTGLIAPSLGLGAASALAQPSLEQDTLIVHIGAGRKVMPKFIGSAVVSKSLAQPATHVYVDGGPITGITVDGGDYLLDNVPALKEDWFIHTPASIWDPGG